MFTQYEIDWYEDLLSSQAGNNEKSLRLALKYFERDPKNYQENYYSGYLSLSLNYVDKAIEIWEHIDDDLIDYPENVRKYWRLGNLSKAYCIAGQPQRALDLLEKHFPFSSGYWYGHWMKIRALVMLDRVQDIRTMIKESSWHSPGFQAEISFFACQEYYIQGKSDMVQEFGQLSIKYYEDDLKKYDDNRNHYRAYQIGVLNYLMDNYSEAYVVFKSFIEKLDNSYVDEELDDTWYPNLYTWALASQSKLLEEEAVINNNYLVGIELTGSDDPIGVGSPYESRSYALAVANAHLGNQDKAVELLNTSFFEKGVFFNYNRYNYDPLLVPLFNNPSFQELVKPRAFKK
ncbi:MAG: hypothetical protein HKN68_19430 [Saprospiraceae bacterium]|nr:hypothetical protein [Saprospiraceae bacterium]